mmetsp:Transcript_28760/g.66825  ORF Transcript_28760/g.66825 Transcript_28760/m.66825 type:complete len:207 (-) Transcript_28760:1616-2236(-)
MKASTVTSSSSTVPSALRQPFVFHGIKRASSQTHEPGLTGAGFPAITRSKVEAMLPSLARRPISSWPPPPIVASEYDACPSATRMALSITSAGWKAFSPAWSKEKLVTVVQSSCKTLPSSSPQLQRMRRIGTLRMLAAYWDSRKAASNDFSTIGRKGKSSSVIRWASEALARKSFLTSNASSTGVLLCSMKAVRARSFLFISCCVS